jgi:chain length determinant protein EpsF
MNQLRHFIEILRARVVLVAVVFAATFLSAVALILFMPKAYTARVSLVTEPKGVDPVTGAALPLPALDGVMATEADIIKSHTVALKVVDTLQMEKDPRWQTLFARQPAGSGALRDWVAERLLEKLDVVPSRDSNVINVDAIADDPRLAAARANAFAEAYIATDLQLKMEPERRQAQWFQEQVKDLRAAVESAQTRLSDYQRRSGLAGTDDKDNRLDVENARLAEVSTELVTAQAAVADAHSRLDQVAEARSRGQLDQIPDLLGNTLLQSLKSDLARAETNFADVSQRYDRNAPPYRSAAAQVDAAERKVASELDNAIGSIRQTAAIAQLRVKELERTLDVQKTRILQLKQKRDTLSILARDADNAQKSYDAAMQRSGSVKLQSQLNQGSVAVLSAAIAPSKPSRPRPILYAVAGLLLGAMLAFAAAMAAELVDRRVHSIRDLAALPDVLVLAEIPGLLKMFPQAL